MAAQFRNSLFPTSCKHRKSVLQKLAMESNKSEKLFGIFWKRGFEKFINDLEGQSQSVQNLLNDLKSESKDGNSSKHKVLF